MYAISNLASFIDGVSHTFIIKNVLYSILHVFRSIYIK